jgi:hypothetical protein
MLTLSSASRGLQSLRALRQASLGADSSPDRSWRCGVRVHEA